VTLLEVSGSFGCALRALLRRQICDGDDGL
jgi:hypothetical protein